MTEPIDPDDRPGFFWVEMECNCRDFNIDTYYVDWEDLKRQIDQHMATCTGKT